MKFTPLNLILNSTIRKKVIELHMLILFFYIKIIVKHTENWWFEILDKKIEYK